MNAVAARLLRDGDVAGFNRQFGAVAVDLSSAPLARVDLSGAELDGANLDGADLTETRLGRVMLRGASLVGAKLDGAIFARCNLARARLGTISADRVTFHLCLLDGAQLASVRGKGWKLEQCTLRAARLTDVELDDCELAELNLCEATLESVALAGRQATAIDATLAVGTTVTWAMVLNEGLDFTGVRLQHLGLHKVIVRGLVLSGAKIGWLAGAESAMMRAEMIGTEIERFQWTASAASDVTIRSCRLGEVDLTGSELFQVSIENSSLSHLDAERTRFIHLRLSRNWVVLGRTGHLLLAGMININETPTLSGLHRGAQLANARIYVDGNRVA